MKIRIQVVIEHDDDGSARGLRSWCVSPAILITSPSNSLGFPLMRPKTSWQKRKPRSLLTRPKRILKHHRCCQKCGAAFQKNRTHQMTIRTLLNDEAHQSALLPVVVKAGRSRVRRKSAAVLALLQKASRNERPQSLVISKPSGHP